MKKFIIFLVATCIMLLSVSFPYAQEKKKNSIPLSASQLNEIILYGNFTGSTYVGKVFNKNKDIVITQITIEAVPKDENNPFNKYSPRLFNVNLVLKPRVMSKEFEIDTGALNPEFHTAKIYEAQGYKE